MAQAMEAAISGSHEKSYLLRREAQERRLAMEATDRCARAVHEKLAEEYRQSLNLLTEEELSDPVAA